MVSDKIASETFFVWLFTETKGTHLPKKMYDLIRQCFALPPSPEGKAFKRLPPWGSCQPNG